MKEKNKLNRDVLSFGMIGCFVVVLIVFHIAAPIGLYDDAVFAEQWRETALSDIWADRYYNWSSRLIIETIMMFLAAHPYLWKILDVLMILLFTWTVADLFGIWSGLAEQENRERRNAQAVFSVLIFTVPMAFLGSAGWVATTANYLWVLTFGVLAMHPIKHWLRSEKCPTWELAVCPLALLYAANMEQMTAILLGVYAVFGIYILRERKKLPQFYFLMLFLEIISLIFIVTTPGNSVRNRVEAELFFPLHAELGIVDKLTLGFLESTHYYVVAGCGKMTMMFGLLTGVLLLALWAKCPRNKGTVTKMAVALFPFLFYWVIGVCGKILFFRLRETKAADILTSLWNHDLPLWGTFSWEEVTIQVVIYLAVLACVALTIYFLHGNSKETGLQLLILGVGFASRMVLGFSATIYRSGDRTTLFATAAILIVVLRNLLIFEKTAKTRSLKIMMLAYVAVNVAGNLWSGIN